MRVAHLGQRYLIAVGLVQIRQNPFGSGADFLAVAVFEVQMIEAEGLRPVVDALMIGEHVQQPGGSRAHFVTADPLILIRVEQPQEHLVAGECVCRRAVGHPVRFTQLQELRNVLHRSQPQLIGSAVPLKIHARLAGATHSQQPPRIAGNSSSQSACGRSIIVNIIGQRRGKMQGHQRLGESSTT